MRGPWLGGRRAAPSTGGAGVLVAGDDRGRVDALAHALRSRGHGVVATYSVARAASHLGEVTERGDRIGFVVLDGSERPWAAGAVVTALRSAGCQLPILLLLGDEPEMRTELGERHARILDANASVEEICVAARDLVTGAAPVDDEVAESRAIAIDGIGCRVLV
jgi:hypothetical protein